VIGTFKQWLEDTGEVFATANDASYAEKGVGSKVVAIEPRQLKSRAKVEKLFGKKKNVDIS